VGGQGFFETVNDVLAGRPARRLPRFARNDVVVFYPGQDEEY
jgi:hypothetical protein